MTTTDHPVALVTGGARRVGRAIVLALAEAGHDVVIHCRRSRAEAEALAATVTGQGRQCWVVEGDFTDAAAPQRVIDTAMRQAARLDVLVNNAAVFGTMGVADFDTAAWHVCQRVNAEAPIALAHHAAAELTRRQGCIVNLLDTMTASPSRRHLAYGASKAALEHLTVALARAMAPTVRVNGVAPGIVLWPEDGRCDAAARKRLLARVPLQRAGTPEEVAAAVRYLVAATYVTGTIVRVDGGRAIT